MSELISACPFIVSNFGEPAIITQQDEYIVLCNKNKTIYLFKSKTLLDSIPSVSNAIVQNNVSTQICIRIFSSPLIIATNGSPQIVLYRNKKFEITRIPIFVMAKFCAILSENIFLVSDLHSVYYFDLSINKCRLCFTTNNEILSLEYFQGKTYVFTSKSFEILSKDESKISIQMNFSSIKMIKHSHDFKSFIIFNGLDLNKFAVSESNIICNPKSIVLPENLIDYAILDSFIIGLFSESNNKKMFLRIYDFNFKGWSHEIDVPPISLLYGSDEFALAACPHYILFLNNSPDVVNLMSENTSLQKAIASFNENDIKKFSMLTLLYGFEPLATGILNKTSLSETIINLILDELWKRKFFDKWGIFALKWLKSVKGQHNINKIIEIMKTQNFKTESCLLFAKMLEKNSDYLNAFIIYLKNHQIESIEKILQNIITKINPYITELLNLCSLMLKQNKTKYVKSIMKCIAEHPIELKPSEILSHLIFSWDLFVIYYESFKIPPRDVSNAYLKGLAIYNPGKLKEFLDMNYNYDLSLACNTLLKLNCINEYEYALKRKDSHKYLEFLVLRENWTELFSYLKNNKNEWPYVLKMMVFSRSYFLEFVKRIDILEISISDLLNEIPLECNAEFLIDGLKYISRMNSIKNESDRIYQEICIDDSNKVLSELVNDRNEEIIINL